MPETSLPPLTDSDRELLALVARAAFANPFGPERDELDRILSGGRATGNEALKLAIQRLEAFLADLRRGGRTQIRHYPAEWREAAEVLILFVLFHRYMPEFDRLIQRQEEEGDRPVPAPFVARLLAEMRAAGFTPEDALKYAGLFYQLRRAFAFLARGLTVGGASMSALRRRLWSNLFTTDMRRYVRHLWNRMEDFSTLLLGETGTGKGAAALAIGRSGFIPFDDAAGAFAQSFTEAFVQINLAEFPSSLLESELFGHRKGSFTGALESRDGVLARCSRHGAIFLDEIGEVPGTAQVKLLRVLQERRYTPVGGGEAKRFEGRVIAATNTDLARARASGAFRDDFYFRLCSDLIEVPSLHARLRETPGELDELARHLLRRLTGRNDTELFARVREVLSRDLPADYPWPGNVRELEQSIRRILLTDACVPSARVEISGGRAEALARRFLDGGMDAAALVAEYCSVLYDRHGSYVTVAAITGLDRRTVRKHVVGEGK